MEAIATSLTLPTTDADPSLQLEIPLIPVTGAHLPPELVGDTPNTNPTSQVFIGAIVEQTTMDITSSPQAPINAEAQVSSGNTITTGGASAISPALVTHNLTSPENKSTIPSQPMMGENVAQQPSIDDQPTYPMTPQSEALPAITSHPPQTASLTGLSPSSLMDRLRGVSLGRGWSMHVPPHRTRVKYLYNANLKIVTTAPPREMATFTAKYQVIANEHHPCEIFVDGDKVTVINHQMETTARTYTDKDRAHYWEYIFNYPCHYRLSQDAKKEALGILRLMLVQNLTSVGGYAPAPLSMEEIQRYLDFFKFSDELDQSGNSNPITEHIIVAVIMANYYSYRSGGVSSINNAATKPTTRTESDQNSSKYLRWKKASKFIIAIACCGMPPNYLKRSISAYNIYRRTLQGGPWLSFLDQARKERANANLVSGLLLSSSVAFLAVPNLVDIAQFFIIVSIGLSLSCVLMGFNIEADEKLSELQEIDIQRPQEGNKSLADMARAMEQHYTLLLLSILFFFLSVFTFTTFSIHSSIVDRTFTVRYLFFSLATSGLVITVGVILRWNYFLRSTTIHPNSGTSP